MIAEVYSEGKWLTDYNTSFLMTLPVSDRTCKFYSQFLLIINENHWDNLFDSYIKLVEITWIIQFSLSLLLVN
jgi:hypothetical protein